MRPMPETKRRRLISRAIRSGEDKAASRIARMLDQRKKALFRELRRANLRKRLVKAEKQQQPPESASGVDWTTWITLFAQGLKTSLVPVAEDIYAVEQQYWTTRDQTLGPLNVDDVIDAYEARVGRQISEIGMTTRNDVIREITTWYNSDAPFTDLLDRLNTYFSPERAEMIARTESQFIAAQIADDTMDQLGISQFNVDLAPEMGGYPCQYCIDQAAANPHNRGDQMPPFHPSCRCGVSYIITPDVITNL